MSLPNLNLNKRPHTPPLSTQNSATVLPHTSSTASFVMRDSNKDATSSYSPEIMKFLRQCQGLLILGSKLPFENTTPGRYKVEVNSDGSAYITSLTENKIKVKISPDGSITSPASKAEVSAALDFAFESIDSSANSYQNPITKGSNDYIKINSLFAVIKQLLESNNGQAFEISVPRPDGRIIDNIKVTSDGKLIMSGSNNFIPRRGASYILLIEPDGQVSSTQLQADLNVSGLLNKAQKMLLEHQLNLALKST